MTPRTRTRMMSMTLLIIAAMVMMNAVPARSAAIDVYVTKAPPAAPIEQVMPARPGYVWASGYYVYRPTGYVWVEGGYIAARPGFSWVSDRWVEDRGRFRFEPGHWTR
jgi:hypothetical protein